MWCTTFNIDYHVEVDRHYYSVPHALVRRQLDVRLTARTVECFYRGRRVASHVRSSRRGRHTTAAEHMPEKHRRMGDWTPERFVRLAEKVGPATAALITTVLERRRHPQLGLPLLPRDRLPTFGTPTGRRARPRGRPARCRAAPCERHVGQRRERSERRRKDHVGRATQRPDRLHDGQRGVGRNGYSRKCLCLLLVAGNTGTAVWWPTARSAVGAPEARGAPRNGTVAKYFVTGTWPRV